MFRHVPGLLYAPSATWNRIHDDIERSPCGFLPLLLIGSLIPALSIYYGAAVAGWSLFGSEENQKFLSPNSAALLAVAVWLAYVTNVIIMGWMVRWVLFRTPVRPSALRGMAFATVLSVPFMLGALAALLPERWLILLVIPIVGGYSALHLYLGLPIFMRLSKSKAYFYATCILAVGLLTMLCVGLFYLESWRAIAPPGDYQGIEERRIEQGLP